MSDDNGRVMRWYETVGGDIPAAGFMIRGGGMADISIVTQPTTVTSTSGSRREAAESRRSNQPKELNMITQTRPSVRRVFPPHADLKSVWCSHRTPWQVWIPPRGPCDFDGDRPGSPILAPYGYTYWPTWKEACEFADEVLAYDRQEGWTYPCTATLPFTVAGPNHATSIIQRLLFTHGPSVAGFFTINDVTVNYDRAVQPPVRTTILFTIERSDHETDYCGTVHRDGHAPDNDAAAIAQLQGEIDEAMLHSSHDPRVTVTVDGRAPMQT